MRHWARNFDTEQSRDAEQEAEDTGNKAPPHKHLTVPLRAAIEFGKLRELPLEKYKGRQKECGTEILPVCKLNSRVVGVWQRYFDEDRMNGDKEGREHAVNDRCLGRGFTPTGRSSIRSDSDEKSAGDNEGREQDAQGRSRAPVN